MEATQEATQKLALELFADAAGGWRLVADLFVDDRPGQLADVSTLIAGHEANIERFSFNRSEDCHKIAIEVGCAQAATLGRLVDALQSGGWLAPRQAKDAALAALDRSLDPGGLLRIKVQLENRPGALAGFARILKERGANVLSLAYDAAVAPGVAAMAMATASPAEVSGLLDRLDLVGYRFQVTWHGADGGPIDAAIGLSAVEAFLFQLRALLPPDKLNDLSELLRTSDELRGAMADFRREAGENQDSMAASEVLSDILRLAAASLGKTGKHFTMRLTGPLYLTERVALYCIACPTGANSYLMQRQDATATLIDSSYGLYFDDAMTWLAGHGMDPAKIGDFLLTHADADHAGWAARLEAVYGARVFAHPDSRQVFDQENRVAGSETRSLAMNGAYTRLINRITDLRTPQTIVPFAACQSAAMSESVAGFRVVGRYLFEDMELLVLESQGGHVSGQVFFFAPEQGALFCGDYLIDVPSLSDRTKSTLSLARALLTSTNSDSRVFSREMKALGELMRATQARLAPLGRTARVFPGHGDFYSMDEAEWLRPERDLHKQA